MTEYQCGRPTKDGTPCKRTRARLPFSLGVGALFGLPVPHVNLPPSCSCHMTPDERTYMDALNAEDAAERERLLLAGRKPPACWAWPISAEIDARADRVTDCADQGDAWELAMRVLRDWQDGRCAICGGPDEVVDHDHASAFVRGLLCRCCNTAEGFASDPGDACVLYRTRNPASILRLQIRYYSPFTGWAEPDRTDEEKFDNRAIAAYVLGERFDRGVASLPREG